MELIKIEDKGYWEIWIQKPSDSEKSDKNKDDVIDDTTKWLAFFAAKLRKERLELIKESKENQLKFNKLSVDIMEDIGVYYE